MFTSEVFHSHPLVCPARTGTCYIEMVRALVKSTAGSVPFELRAVQFNTILFLDGEMDESPVVNVEIEQQAVSISSRRDGGKDLHSTMELALETVSSATAMKTINLPALEQRSR